MLRRLFSLDCSDDVVIAQVEAFSRRVPILYGVLITNTVALAVTHYGTAPDLLTAWIPLIVCLFMAARSLQWLRTPNRTITAAQARGLLRHMTRLAFVLALSMLVWGCLLYQSGYHTPQEMPGITRRGYAILYIGWTVLCCVTLLMHVRLAALVVTLTVCIPFCAYLSILGSEVERAVAINLSLVAAAMLYVQFVFSKDFEVLINSRSELRAIGEQQTLLANTDPLTGLANRRKFFALYDKLKDERASFALLAIDLDGFKQVNDAHGHPIGDRVLVEVARRIAEAASPASCVARTGGDEFALIVTLQDPAALTELGGRIVRTASEPIVAARLSIAIGASVGISIVAASDVAGNPIEQADYALTYAKQTGKGRVVTFASHHESTIRRRSLVDQYLRAADLEGEIEVVFQPIVHAASHGIAGFEALARWHSPVLGAVSPVEFIPAAERGAVIHAVSRVVLTKALREAARWPSDIGLKVNLSARDIGDPAQMLAILGIVAASPVSASRLTLELTETAFGIDLDVVGTSVAMIKAAGVSLAIDDFGTGYSSLSYVHRLAPDLIKIDRSFVQRIGCGDGAESIIKTIIELCRNIGARSLAEGVEEPEQAELLARLGVQELQGYLFGRPLPVDRIAPLIAGSAARPDASPVVSAA